jgi:PAS domain S-box-containing protein
MPRVLETLLDGVAICDRDWRFMFVNQKAADLTGRSPEELLGQTLWDIYPQAKDSTFAHELKRVLTEQVAVRFQSFHTASIGYIEVRAYPTPQGVLILHQDITSTKQVEADLQQTCNTLSNQIAEQLAQLQHTRAELAQQTQQRQQAEAALQATNQAFARLLESITDGFCAVDTAWQFTYVNRRAEQLLQRYASELLGKNIWKIFPPLVGSEFYRSCYEAVDKGSSVQLEMFFADLERWFELSLYPSDSGLSIFFQDITIRKHMQQERNQLLQQEQSARTRAELAHQRCMFLSHASSILASSLNYETTLSNVAQLAVPLLADFCLIHKLEGDRTLHQVTAWHGDERKQPLVDQLGRLYQVSSQNRSSLMAQVLRTGEPLMVTDFSAIEPLTQDAQTLEIHRQLAPRSLMIVPLTARGQKFGTLMLAMAESNRQHDALDLAVATDLARRAAIAIDNAHLYKQAQEASRLKDEFLMTLSHELRSPLNAIVGWSQMLQHRHLSQRTTEQALEVIEQKATALTQLVYDLLSLSQIVTGQLRLQPGLVKLDEMIQEVIQSLQVAATAKDIRLEVYLDGAIEPIQGDGRYLRQVFWNLVSNAIKFTPSSGLVEIRLLQTAQNIQFMVRDTGKGISPDILPYIFDIFRQADSSSTRFYDGMGIGLSLVHHLVELHGGTVEGFSEGEGQGAMFTVTLPVVSPISTIAAQSQFTHESANSTSTTQEPLILENVRVLLVDANLHSRDALLAQLEEDGAEVLGVASSADAMEIVENFKPHILLVCFRNQRVGNAEMKLLAKIKAQSVEWGRCLPAIALMAQKSQQARSQVLSLGFQVCLSHQSPPEDIAMVVGALAKQNQSVSV